MKQILTKKAKRFLLDIPFPNKCPVCMRAIRWDKYICEECAEALPFIEEGKLCRKCGRPHPENKHCETERAFDAVYGVLWYRDKGKKAMYNLKHRYGFNIAELAATHIYTQLEKAGLRDKIDCITYVPMHKDKEYRRGYNQAEEYAKALSDSLGLPLANGFIEHKKTSSQQHDLKGADRREGARSAYILGKKKPSDEQKVCILADDIFTTGSTLDICAGLLKEAGFETVICVSVCVTPYKLGDDEYEDDYEE